MPTKPPALARSPEREALAAAIEEKRERDRQGAAIQAAYEAADEATFAIARQMDEILKTMRDRPKMLVGTALTGKNVDVDPQVARELRDRLESHQTDLDDTKALRAALRAQMDEHDNRFDYPAQRIREAATAVLQAETGDMVAAAVAAIAKKSNEIARLRGDLGWLNTFNVFGQLKHEIPAAVSEALAPAHDGSLRVWQAMRASSDWGGVMDGLMADADFGLPSAPKD